MARADPDGPYDPRDVLTDRDPLVSCRSEIHWQSGPVMRRPSPLGVMKRFRGAPDGLRERL